MNRRHQATLLHSMLRESGKSTGRRPTSADGFAPMAVAMLDPGGRGDEVEQVVGHGDRITDMFGEALDDGGDAAAA